MQNGEGLRGQASVGALRGKVIQETLVGGCLGLEGATGWVVLAPIPLPCEALWKPHNLELKDS